MQRPIHINLAVDDPSNIKAEDDAAWLTALLGSNASSTSAILPFGDRLEITKLNNNEVRMDSGVYSMQGFCIKIPDNEVFNINTGNQGKKRIDLLIAEYHKNSPRDSYEIKVIKGTPNVGAPEPPALTVQDLHFGGSIRQEEIARVLLDGTEIIDITVTAKVVKGLNAIDDEITKIENGQTEIGKAKDSDKLGGHAPNKFLMKSGGIMTGNVDFSGNSIFGLSNPTSSSQAVNKGYADNKFLPKTAKAVDSDKLDGHDSTYFADKAWLSGILKDADYKDIMEWVNLDRDDYNGNFNWLRDVGHYTFRANAIVSTWSNRPCDHAGWLTVYTLNRQSAANVQDKYLVQEYLSYHGKRYTRRASGAGNNPTWEPWICNNVSYGTSTPTSLELGEIYVKY